jgi:hypothetical protein
MNYNTHMAMAATTKLTPFVHLLNKIQEFHHPPNIWSGVQIMKTETRFFPSTQHLSYISVIQTHIERKCYTTPINQSIKSYHLSSTADTYL